ncbi:MAG: SsrA-binding protein SmpB [Candidatus Peribacteraceae bacterium]|nr:SsrA-binding protein SmpB [Candidatus Peribacteraceae bacterium]MDD5074726.1 SsrA-binding protein SmpB [Candidatus Peribacteraceae bacterium]
MKVTAQNRRARFDYEILETTEAGIVLTGQEAKSCRMGHVNLSGAYVSFLREKPVLKNMGISRYTYASKNEPYDERRDRDLLLSATEIHKLQTKTEEKGMAVVPLELHVGKFVKVLLGLGRGRKKVDKRHRIKEREVERKLKSGGEY